MTKDEKITTDLDIRDVEILEETQCYKGFMSVDRVVLRHRLHEGGWSAQIHREVMRRTPGVGVLLYDPDLDKVLMVEQFRVGCLDDPAGPWKLELVAGLIDTDETVEEIAIREAKEEADTDIVDLIPVCEYYNSPGSSNEKLHIFCARFDARKTSGVFGLDKEHEDIRTVIVSREQAELAVRNGTINNAMSLIALQWLSLNLDRVKAQMQQNI